MKTNFNIVRWTVTTGIMLALLIVFQIVLGTVSGNNTLVVGSAVNLVLIVSALFAGAASGAAVAVISPFFAFMLGIGTTQIILVPFIALGNLVLVLCWSLIMKNPETGIKTYYKMITALVAAAVIKFAVLYFSVVKYAIPVLLTLPEAGAKTLSANFSLPQLFTASIGGIIAVIIYPVLCAAKPRKNVKDDVK